MIVVTGGAGFIGSALLAALNDRGVDDILVVDELGADEKWLNLRKRRYSEYLHKSQLDDYLATQHPKVTAIFHLGACSSTTESDADYLMANNTRYSMNLFRYCSEKEIPFIYASSAATYGDGELGYSDEPQKLSELRPINKYGYSKHLFDLWAMRQNHCPKFWAGLKFFNVYGPNEYHKGSQASVVFHAFPQIKEGARLKLFRSYREGIADGEQRRDFVYVKDAVKVMLHLYDGNAQVPSGVYNLGTGKARTFVDLGKAVFKALDIKPNFEWIDMPANVKNQYQYFTEAELSNLRNKAGYTDEFTALEDGVGEYVSQYLSAQDAYL